ncbi:MAG: hypothetical protein IKP79_01280, partial [Bacilli bacterium]|nr:hypothetical protein [Bacilli bacterium]
MKKQVYECLKEEIIGKILPIDQYIASVENIFDYCDSDAKVEKAPELEKTIEYQEKKKRRLVFETLSEYIINEDEKNNLYVL